LKTNQSVERAAALLRLVADQPHGATVADASRNLGWSQPTVSRLLATLELTGLVRRTPGSRAFVLGHETARLGRIADPNGALLQHVEPFLQDLAARCRETVTLSVQDPSGGVDVIRQISGPNFIGDHSWIGLRPPNHATSNGKAFLAELSDEELTEELKHPLERFTPHTVTSPTALRQELVEVKRQGYATMLHDLEEGLAGISVPVRDSGGRLLAAVSVSGPTNRYDERARHAALEDLRKSVAEIERGLNAPAGRRGRE